MKKSSIVITIIILFVIIIITSYYEYQTYSQLTNEFVSDVVDLIDENYPNIDTSEVMFAIRRLFGNIKFNFFTIKYIIVNITTFNKNVDV